MRVTICDYCRQGIDQIWTVEVDMRVRFTDPSPNPKKDPITGPEQVLMHFCTDCGSRFQGPDLRVIFLRGLSEYPEKESAVL